MTHHRWQSPAILPLLCGGEAFLRMCVSFVHQFLMCLLVCALHSVCFCQPPHVTSMSLCVGVCTQTVGEESRFAGKTHNLIGKIYFAKGDAERAVQHLTAAVRIMEKKLGMRRFSFVGCALARALLDHCLQQWWWY